MRDEGMAREDEVVREEADMPGATGAPAMSQPLAFGEFCDAVGVPQRLRVAFEFELRVSGDEFAARPREAWEAQYLRFLSAARGGAARR